APYVSAVLVIACSKLIMQRRLFIKENKQMHAQSNRCHDENQHPVGMSEYNPEPNPSCCEPKVYGIAHIPIEANHYKVLRRSHWSRCAAARPAKVPDTTQRNRKSQHRRNCPRPPPACRARQLHVKAQPSRQQPEPQT